MRSSTAVRTLLAGVVIATVTAVQPVFASSGTTPASDPTPAPTVSTGPPSVAPTAPTDGPTTSAPATAEPTATTTPTAPPTSDSPVTTPPTTPATPPIAVPAPVPPATVSPAVTIDPVATRNCRDAAGMRLSTKLALAQSAYDAAQTAYQAQLDLRRVGTIGDLELAPALIALAQATIALDSAKYELALCQTNGGNDPKKDCAALLLRLNQVGALIAQRQLIVDAAQLQYNLTQLKVNVGSLPPAAMGPVKKVLDDAKAWLADARQDEQDVHTAMNAVAERCGFMRWPDPPTR